MAEKFDCPACGAPLDVPEDAGATIRCPYCSASVVVPVTLRDENAGQEGQVIQIDLRGLTAGQTGFVVEPDDPIMVALREGKKIEAIKLYRERTGLGLKESKDAIETMQAGMAAVDPVSIGARPAVQGNARAGCILAAVLLALILMVSIGAAVAGALATTSVVSEIRDELVVTTVYELSPTPGPLQLVMTAGEEGEGAGKMTDARSVTQDREGTIYVADYLPGRVQAFSAAGEFITQWHLEDPDQQIYSVVALPAGRLAVIVSDAIEIRDGRNGDLLESWSDNANAGFGDAWLMSDGNLAVTCDTASVNDVILFNPQGQVVKRIENAFSSQTGDGEMSMSVAADSQGNLYLLGGFNRLVLKYGPQGKFLTRIGGQGNQPGQFTFPDEIAVDSTGRVYVSEGLKIHIFDPGGRFIEQFEADGVASGMYVNAKDELLVAARDKVLVYKPMR